jgi:hypothetical protein
MDDELVVSPVQQFWPRADTGSMGQESENVENWALRTAALFLEAVDFTPSDA